VSEPAWRATPAVGTAAAICSAEVAGVSDGGASVWDGPAARDGVEVGLAGAAEADFGGGVAREAAADDTPVGTAETGAGQTPSADVGAVGLSAAGTYRNPSASPSRSTRLEMPTLESRHDPPPVDTKTAQ
jgi:hypothetical protein